MWMLGNESNYGEVGNPDPKSNNAGLGSNAKKQPDAHYAFVNEIAGYIKTLDPKHPVGYSNGEVITIDILSKYSHNIDVFGCNAYRGSSGFGRSFWVDVQKNLDKPVLLTEYGCPAYFAGKSADFAEDKQLEYHQGNWEDILYNSAGSGVGNSIGGTIFEFVDEWWKSGLPPKFSPSEHETVGDFVAAFPDGWMHEEWLGLMSQGDGSQSPFLRQARKAYDYYKKVWNQK
jgi:beta-glucuronidase